MDVDLTGARLLWGTSLRGLAARRGLAVGSWMLTAIAVASAVVGPSYEGTSAHSFVITPRALPSFHLTSGVRLSIAVLAFLLVAAAAFARVIVRGAPTSSLRESAC